MRQQTLNKRSWLTSQLSGQQKSYHPQLYVLKTKVYNEGQLVDVTEDTLVIVISTGQLRRDSLLTVRE